MPSTYFDVNKLQASLVEFGNYVESIDMDHVERQTIKQAATSLAEMVRQAVNAEDDIDSPARLLSPYENGPGPSLVTRKAWDVKKKGNQYIVKPNPKVQKRAEILNAGRGEITPNTAPRLAFTVNGLWTFPESVKGVDKTEYWQAALQRFNNSDELERIATQELREEALK